MPSPFITNRCHSASLSLRSFTGNQEIGPHIPCSDQNWVFEPLKVQKHLAWASAGLPICNLVISAELIRADLADVPRCCFLSFFAGYLTSIPVEQAFLACRLHLVEFTVKIQIILLTHQWELLTMEKGTCSMSCHQGKKMGFHPVGSPISPKLSQTQQLGAAGLHSSLAVGPWTSL